MFLGQDLRVVTQLDLGGLLHHPLFHVTDEIIDHFFSDFWITHFQYSTTRVFSSIIQTFERQIHKDLQERLHLDRWRSFAHFWRSKQVHPCTGRSPGR